MPSKPKTAPSEAAAPATASVFYRPTFSPICAKADCKCSGPDALVIGSRIERQRPRNVIAVDAKLCMACGAIRPMEAEFDHYHHALAHFWAEWGWNRAIGTRLKEFADLSTDTPFESFCALHSGMSPAECAAYSTA